MREMGKKGLGGNYQMLVSFLNVIHFFCCSVH